MSKICTKCGAENPDDSCFCQECGEKFPTLTSRKKQENQQQSEFPKYFRICSWINVILSVTASITMMIIGILCDIEVISGTGWFYPNGVEEYRVFPYEILETACFIIMGLTLLLTILYVVFMLRKKKALFWTCFALAIATYCCGLSMVPFAETNAIYVLGLVLPNVGFLYLILMYIMPIFLKKNGQRAYSLLK